MIIDNCIVCGYEFQKTRVDKVCCAHPCVHKLHRLYKSEYSHLDKKDFYKMVREWGPFWKPKKKHRERVYNDKELNGRENVRKFFLACQAKNWQLDRFDILHLLMVFADLFPNRETREYELRDPEKFYTKVVLLIKNKLML